jgi:hypothetical protein
MRKKRFGIALVGLLTAGLIAFPVASAVGSSARPESTRSNVLAATALGNAFTFQGRLLDGGNPATGLYDLRFVLYDDGIAGASVGPIVNRDDIQVTNGLFTVQLDFGAVFDSNTYWIEIAVRPGASTGTYTTLSPRTQITAVPQSLYSKEAKTLTAGATISGSGLTILTVENTNAAASNTLIVNHSGSDGVAVAGYALGTSGTPVGIDGYAASPDGIGGHFAHQSASGVALQVEGVTELKGALKVGGSAPIAFQHTVAGGDDESIIDNPATNGDPNAILLITHVWGKPTSTNNVYVEKWVGVYYIAGTTNKWALFTEDNTNFPANATYNILVIKR